MPACEAGLRYGALESPVGRLLVAGDGESLHRIVFPADTRVRERPADWRRDDGAFAETFRQLKAYFAGELDSFDLPLRFAGTAFQNTVWKTLLSIPFGETVSYAALAARIGRPTAYRAVGAANGANPLPVVVPCHRVIGSDRSLTGFGGGIETKRFLLAHEQKVAAP
ncbi:methylated-DNA--[protein]-cysteine S-methyltransferase [Pelagibius sp.]|uniref:methylated-DNA--[protein]-cysteine S-methyltransferase n=1 Tax=Pelagibius sp. TaxID=1931238 RepID=UPI002630A315|nr:methylated-DNA--[protein]-cysteine S-methyltransferase [Pelagibius sp.]